MSNISNKRALPMAKDPMPYICAEPLPSNNGPEPEMTPFEGGYYHGNSIISKEFPFKPLSTYMITPNERFKLINN
uniref:UBC core domain-containing protein n=1 Tax=Gallus gallus TaxID=9031 RepID=A0A8V0XB60_CHICK